MFAVSYVGRLAADAEYRVLESGKGVLSFRTACNVRKGREESVVWASVSYWGPGGDKMVEFLQKGKEVFVVGGLTTREYESGGQQRTSLEVRADSVRFVGGSKQDGAAAHAKTHASNTAQDDGNGSGGGSDDDIPFITCAAEVAANAATPKWERW